MTAPGLDTRPGIFLSPKRGVNAWGLDQEQTDKAPSLIDNMLAWRIRRCHTCFEGKLYVPAYSHLPGKSCDLHLHRHHCSPNTNTTGLSSKPAPGWGPCGFGNLTRPTLPPACGFPRALHSILFPNLWPCQASLPSSVGPGDLRSLPVQTFLTATVY